MIAAFDNPGSILNISGVSSRKIIDICADMFPFCISYTESDLYTMKKNAKILCSTFNMNVTSPISI